MAKKEQITENFLNKNRLGSLIDGVFATCMTILVLTIDFPPGLDIKDDIVIANAVMKMIPQVIIYFTAFGLLSLFWYFHHSRFECIKRIDKPFIIINIIWLMFIALIPFSTSLSGDYPYLHTAVFVFHINFFILSAFLFLLWFYAMNNNLIDEKIDKKMILANRDIKIVMIVVCLLALVFSFVSPPLSILVYFLIIPGTQIIKFFNRS